MAKSVSVISPAETREIVASLPDRKSFDAAVAALLAAGFERTELSVLATHDSLEIAAPDAAKLDRNIPAMLAAEWPYIGPLAVAGLILITAGPVGALLAALVGAGVGGMALRQVMDGVVAESHAEGFTRAIESGEILLWVRTGSAERTLLAERLLTAAQSRSIRRLDHITAEGGAP